MYAFDSDDYFNYGKNISRLIIIQSDVANVCVKFTSSDKGLSKFLILSMTQ